MRNGSFRYVVGVDDEHERLMAEVEHQGKMFIILNSEGGPGDMEVEIFSPEDNNEPFCRAPLKDLIEILEMARDRIIAMRRNE